jgi:predicted  nucleic acid-binding Zn-ribbon protein
MQMASACLPVLLKQFTGQDMMSSLPGSNNIEMQMALSQVLSLQQQILTTQQSLSERISDLESNLISLDKNASNNFTNLVQEVKGIKSVRLTHQKETRAIDYDLQPENETNKY